ncbi:hypothetical protein C0992_002469 [Termitomyces sp. T32_za158]|nr:hypothetical protein C0992_002469 [Termitomyces sp. T32_za158]
MPSGGKVHCVYVIALIIDEFMLKLVCEILELLPLGLQCPTQPPTNPSSSTSDGYTQVFSNLTGATEAGDYLTYGLVDTVSDCKAMCNTVNGCTFVNTYHDVHGKLTMTSTARVEALN